MFPELTPQSVLVALGVANVAVLMYLLVRRYASGAADGRESQVEQGGGGSVECPDCHTANDPYFRFCRECMAELPAGVDEERPTGAMDGQRS